jgi:hypothetical protein
MRATADAHWTIAFQQLIRWDQMEGAEREYFFTYGPPFAQASSVTVCPLYKISHHLLWRDVATVRISTVNASAKGVSGPALRGPALAAAAIRGAS